MVEKGMSTQFKPQAAGDFARRVIDGVAELKRSDRGLRVFGANGHGYQFNARLDKTEVAACEQQWGMKLPADYVEFLTQVGNGGAGPFYGVFRLGEWDGSNWGEPWNININGDPSKAFPHRAAWNEVRDRASAPADGESREYDEWLEREDQRYWAPEHTNGSIPICTLGCALRFVLIVAGPEAGHVWRDDRADENGLYPLGTGTDRVSFSDWYLSWLNEAFKQVLGAGQS
jgi:hypothetical protein